MNDMEGKKTQKEVVKRDEDGFLTVNGDIVLEMNDKAVIDFAEKYLLTEDPEKGHPSTIDKLINGYNEIKRLNEMPPTEPIELTEPTDQQITQTKNSQKNEDTGKQKKKKGKGKKKEKTYSFKYDDGSVCLVFKGKSQLYNTKDAAEDIIKKNALKKDKIKLRQATSEDIKFLSDEVKSVFCDAMLSHQPNND